MKTIVPLLILLAACTHYPDACDRRALNELRVVNRLIGQTQANLARGYTYETVETGFRTGFTVCSGSRNAALCTGSNPTYTRRAVATDPEAEERKLQALRERREALTQAASSCQPV